MTSFIALLRGVNVGGRIIKMAELKSCFEKAGFKDVKTYLQSGNVVFKSSKNEVALKQEIEQLLTKTYKYDAKVIVLSSESLKEIIKDNPFTKAAEDYHQYVIFFSDNRDVDFVAEVKKQDGEEVKAGRGVVYWKVKKGDTLKSPTGKLLSKTKYKEFNTNRNINTLLKLIAQ